MNNDICKKDSKSCFSMNNSVDKEIILLNNYFYGLLNYYTKGIFADESNMAINMDIYQLIEYYLNYLNPNNYKNFEKDNIELFDKIISDISSKMDKNFIIDSADYKKNIFNVEIKYFGGRSNSIILSGKKLIDGEEYDILIKVVPLNLNYYKYRKESEFFISSSSKINSINSNIYNFINSIPEPSFRKLYVNNELMGLFYREAWMYCYCNITLKKFTDAFVCVYDCMIVDELPFDMTGEFKEKYYRDFSEQKKKWFNLLLDRKNANTYNIDPDKIAKLKFGVFEMDPLGLTVDQYLGEKVDNNESGILTISMVFEYLYARLVLAQTARILLLDDHSNNIVIRENVNHVRKYSISTSEKKINFYMHGTTTFQFIDLESYIFNEYEYDMYLINPLLVKLRRKLDELRKQMAYDFEIFVSGFGEEKSSVQFIFFRDYVTKQINIDYLKSMVNNPKLNDYVLNFEYNDFSEVLELEKYIDRLNETEATSKDDKNDRFIGDLKDYIAIGEFELEDDAEKFIMGVLYDDRLGDIKEFVNMVLEYLPKSYYEYVNLEDEKVSIEISEHEIKESLIIK